MIKKLMWLLSIVGVLSFSSCGGGGSSNEAKELLSKILHFVGLPQTIVANICQDANRDGICGGGELFTKVTINKGDNIDDIWKKISLTENGQYFLETYNPELPILVELQDVAKVNYDSGKFTLAFNGFKTKKDDNETKEVSILESMVDANTLTKTVANMFRTLTNSEAQDKYYTALLDSLETNINTLRTNELDRATAMSATIKEMADETIDNQEIANRINACGNDQTCIDNKIKKMRDELIITDEEIIEIKARLQVTSTPTPSSTSGAKEEIYGKWVKPSKNSCEDNKGVFFNFDHECEATWENAKTICSSIGGNLATKKVLEAVVTDCGGVIDDYEHNINNSYQTCYRKRGFTSDDYWSSTLDVSDSNYAWIVGFNLGSVGRASRWSGEKYVRCVRGGQ